MAATTLQQADTAAATQFNQFNRQSTGGYHHESFDDKHIIAKHNLIYPSQDEVFI